LFTAPSTAGHLLKLMTTRNTLTLALAHHIADTLSYKGEFLFDTTRPDGTPRNLLDNQRITELGWQAQTPLAEGLEITYNWVSERNHGFRS